MPTPYVPLRIFSSYTMLEGAIEPKAIAKQAKKLDLPAAALTDRNGLYAVMPFTDACISEGVQPIIGTFLAVARAGTPEGKPPMLDWLALYAQDERGYAPGGEHAVRPRLHVQNEQHGGDQQQDEPR